MSVLICGRDFHIRLNMQAPGFSGIGGGRMEDAKMIEEVH
jgi:hypothetical protein